MCDKNCANKPKSLTLNGVEFTPLLEKVRLMEQENKVLKSENNNLKLENEVLLAKVLLLAKAIPPSITHKPTAKVLPHVKP